VAPASQGARCTDFLSRFRADVFSGVVSEELFTRARTKVEILSVILGVTRRTFFIYFHLANWIDLHGSLLLKLVIRMFIASRVLF
jgi:hypothetical protein